MTDKKKNRTGTLIRMFKYLLQAKWLLLLAICANIVSNVLSLMIPSFSGAAIDGVIGKGQVNFDVVFNNCKLMLLCVVGNGILGFISQFLIQKVSTRVSSNMRREIFNHLLTLPVSFFDNNQTGDIISVISYDVDTVNMSLSNDLIMVVMTIITVTGSFTMMMKIAPQLCVIFLFTIPVVLLITRYRAKIVKPLFSLRSKKLGELNGFVEEMLSGQKTIKGYGREETIISKFDEKNEIAVSTYYDADYQGSIVGPTVNFVNNFSLSMASGLGALLFLGGKVSLGNISSFIQYSRRFSGPISELANIYSELQSAMSAAERVFRLLDEPSEKLDNEGALIFDKVNGEVEIKDVRFSYNPEREIIHGLNLKAEPGKMIAIVGPTGAGKTTIINLLMRFYDIDSGSIMVDGKDIYNVTRDSLRKQYSMVLQDTWLFSGSIYENIAYGSDSATKEDVIRVCKAAHIHDFVMSLKDGYDTILTDDGVNISKGQKQLLTIARAMLANSQMLILDEATSNVDSRTEAEIQSAMLELCKGKTSFVIAHRLSTIKNADTIVVFRDGNVIEQGSHDELLNQKGFYASLFNAQWEN